MVRHRLSLPTLALVAVIIGWVGGASPADSQQPSGAPGGDLREETYSSIESRRSNEPGDSTETGLLRSDRQRAMRLADPAGDSASGEAAAIDAQRERLYNDLAEEFSAFQRLGNLVRRVSLLAKPSVIHIEAHKTEENGGVREAYDEAGAGVVISTAGDTWVLTNRHVIAGASKNEILLRTSDGREQSPSRVLADRSTDIAVLELPETDLPAARLGDSADVEIGDFVIAIGSPFGLAHSVTFGIVSAKGRRDLSLGSQQIDLQDFFQTDAAINPGNSGGPLLNLRGEVVAINTAIASSSGGSEGIGFAIPINMAIRVADELIRHGNLRRGYLGVTLDPDFSAANFDTPAIQAAGGALIKDVRPGSPAEAARLRSGDIIVEFAGTPIENDDHLVANVGLTPVGDPVPMIIVRDGKRYRTDVVLQGMPSEE